MMGSWSRFVFDPQLEVVGASVRRLMEQSAQQAQQLDHLASAPAPSGSPFAAFGMPGLGGPPAAAPPEPRPILELDGEEREIRRRPRRRRGRNPHLGAIR